VHEVAVGLEGRRRLGTFYITNELEAEMRSIATAFLAFLACPVLYGQSPRGTICVAPVSPERPTLGREGGFYNPATYTMRIDKVTPIVGPHKDFVQIGDLELNKRHVVLLTSDGKTIQSIWFRFSDYGSSHLCLSFDSYLLIQMKDTKQSPWCKCK
jgi:hypothetical protein